MENEKTEKVMTRMMVRLDIPQEDALGLADFAKRNAFYEIRCHIRSTENGFSRMEMHLRNVTKKTGVRKIVDFVLNYGKQSKTQ
jgi:hypothetical protein